MVENSLNYLNHFHLVKFFFIGCYLNGRICIFFSGTFNVLDLKKNMFAIIIIIIITDY